MLGPYTMALRTPSTTGWLPLLALLALAAAPLPSRGATQAGPAGEPPTYEFGVLPQVGTAKLTAQWEPFVERLSQRAGVRLHFVTAPSIAEFVKRANAGSYAFYYHNTLAYVQQGELYRAFAREKGARTVGVLVVRKEAPIARLADLKGGRVALPSRISFGAAVLPLYALQQEGRLDLERDVRTILSGSHEAGYQAVLDGEAEAAGGLTRTFALLPEAQRSRLRILYRTKDYSPLPFAARQDVPSEVVARVQKALVEFGNDPADAPLLEALKMTGGFEAARPADWDDVRAARQELQRVSRILDQR
jgi:phosphonate transport system substrate-binding protein